MSGNEAQIDEGQVQAAVIEADITGMTEAEIGQKIDEDAAFAKAYMEGRIVKNDGESEPAAEADAEAAAAAAAEAETPAEQPSEEGAAPEPAKKADPEPEPEPKSDADPEPQPGADKVFTIKKGELPQGFDTPGKVFKSLADKQAYIEQIQGQVGQRDNRIAELEAELRAERQAKQQADDEKQAQAEAADDEIDDEKLYDPEFMKAQLKRLRKMDKLEAELNELRTTVSQSQEKTARTEKISQELRQLASFQAKFPALKTEQSFDEIDQQYGKFVEGIAEVTGASDMEEALKFVNVYLQDNGEDGNNLRAAAKQAEIQPPAEIEPYLKIMRIRETAQRVVNMDPKTKQPRPLSLEEAFKLTYPDLYVQAGKAAPKPKPRAKTKAEEKAATEEAQRQYAEKQDSEAAADIAPGQSGQGESVDDLSDQQIDELMAMSPAQLRANPRKKALLDAVFRKLDIKPLHVNGQPDALT